MFSFILYSVSSQALNRSLPPQVPHFNQFSPDAYNAFEAFRAQQLENGRKRLRTNLLLINLVTLALGGGASYLLARRTLRPIEESLEMQTRFTADASHELRTPLAAMQTEIEVALRDPKLSSEESHELLRSNLEEVGKLRELADGLLRLARGEREQFEMQSVELAVVISEAVRRVESRAKARAVTITNEGGNAVTHGDQTSLIEAVVILLDNAIKYSPKGATVAVAVESRGRHALITVSDQGIGIAESDLPHVFDRFFRADNSRSKQHVEGHGLGLSIAQNIAQLHHGSIVVRSAVGAGSAFSLKIPYIGTHT